MKKRLPALLLAAALLLSLAACGAPAAEEAPPVTDAPDETTPGAATPAPEPSTGPAVEPAPEPKEPEALYALKAGAGVGTIHMDPSIFPTEGFSGEVNDDPHVRVLLLEAGERAAIVSCELVNTPAEAVSGIIGMVAEKAGVPEENVWIHSTHAITTPHNPGNGSVLTAAEAALEQALESFAPARLGVGTIECDVNANRNIPTPEGVVGGPYYGRGSTEYSNKTMTMLRFDGEDGSPIAFFMSYGIKPTAIDNSEMAAGTRVISTDVPGRACAMVEEAFGAPCLFCMPAAGDQYPKEMALYYDLNEAGNRMEEVDLGVAAGLEIVDRLGDEMGNAAISLAGSISCEAEESAVSSDRGSFTASERRMAQVSEVTIDVSALRLGDIAFVGFKQELDAQTEKEIREGSPFDHTLLISFLNGDGKYMPHDAAYDYNGGKGTYEVLKSGFARGTAEKLADLALELLDGLN